MDERAVVLVFAVLGAYLLPGIIALARGHNSAGWVLALNISCGWTWYGWAVALVWAVAGSTHWTTNPSPVAVGTETPDPDGGEPMVTLPRRRPSRAVGSNRRFRTALSVEQQVVRGWQK